MTVPTVFLREILEAGFCGRRLAKGVRGMGFLHAILDKILVSRQGSYASLESEPLRIQLANQHGIPYEDMPYFHRCLMGIAERAELLMKCGFAEQDSEVDLASAGKVNIRYLWAYEGGTPVEINWNFYVPQHHTPFMALYGACFRGCATTDVRSIAILGDLEHREHHVVRGQELLDLLNWAYQKADMRAGAQCFTCSATDCTFKNEFEAKVFAWLKAKQQVEALEEEVRQHLIMQGPTKAGSHLFHMKEHQRRFFNPKNFIAFESMVQKHAPKGHMQYFNPDAKAVYEAVRKGDLPKEILQYFKESRYHTIESGPSL